MEESPVDESQSNGAVERTVQQIQGQIRTIKDCLESRIGRKISGEENVFPWMVAHAAATINRYHVGQDGRTSYRRWKGKDFKREVAEFGEQVLYLKMGTKGKNKLDSRWERGIWLGVKDSTGEIIVGTPEGVVKARDFKHLTTPSDRWSATAVSNLQGTPWQPIPGRGDERIPVCVRLPEEGRDILPNPDSIAGPRPEIKRRARISRDDVRKYGYTINCPGS